MIAILDRLESNDKQTLGRLRVYNGLKKPFECVTLELPDLDNQRYISCIPAGTYEVVKRWSVKHSWHYELLNVKDRDLILIHTGNKYTDILGCILVGRDYVDINNDGYLDVNYSRRTLDKLINTVPDSFKLIINDIWKL